MDKKIRGFLLRVVSLGAQHCERVRPARLHFEPTPEDVILDIASNMLHLLESHAEAWRYKAIKPSGIKADAGGWRMRRRPGLDRAQ